MSDELSKGFFCPHCREVKEEVIGGKLRVVDTDDMNFMVLEHRATQERRKALQDFIAKYGPIIGLALVIVFGIVMAYFGFEFLDKQMSKQVAACQQFAMNDAATNTPKEASSNPIPVVGNLLLPNSAQSK